MEIIRLNSKIYNLNKFRYLTPIQRIIKDVEKYRYYVDNTLKIQCKNLGINIEDVLNNSLEPEEFVYYGFTFVFEQDNEELCFPTFEQAKKGYKQALTAMNIANVDETLKFALKKFLSYPKLHHVDYIQSLLGDQYERDYEQYMEKSCSSESIPTL